MGNSAAGTIVVTGATGGMGRVLCRALAERGFDVVLACRNIERGERLREEIAAANPGRRLRVLALDLSAMDSVRGFADVLLRTGEPLRGILNNAGIMAPRFELTPDGYETDVAVNCLGPLLLTRLLLPLLKPDGRIVNTISCTWRLGRIDEHFFRAGPERFGRFRTYGTSKLALLLLTLELIRRTKNLPPNVYAVDPGIVDTNMITLHKWFDPLADALFRPFIQSPEQGAATALHLITCRPAPAMKEEYWKKGHPVPPPASVRNHPLREWLWEETEKRLGIGL